MTMAMRCYTEAAELTDNSQPWQPLQPDDEMTVLEQLEQLGQVINTNKDGTGSSSQDSSKPGAATATGEAADATGLGLGLGLGTDGSSSGPKGSSSEATNSNRGSHSAPSKYTRTRSPSTTTDGSCSRPHLHHTGDKEFLSVGDVLSSPDSSTSYQVLRSLGSGTYGACPPPTHSPRPTRLPRHAERRGRRVLRALSLSRRENERRALGKTCGAKQPELIRRAHYDASEAPAAAPRPHPTASQHLAPTSATLCVARAGLIFVVRDVTDNFLWALKVPKRRSYNEMFRNEADTMKKIIHPHILALRDAFEVPPSPSPSSSPHPLVRTMLRCRHCSCPNYGGVWP